MRYAVDIPNFCFGPDPRATVELAVAAESAGWDAVWIWDHVAVDAAWRAPFKDPWLLLGAIAAATTRIRLGPLVTPLPRRRPWHVAREAVTLDWLSGGRLTLGVGLGNPPAEFELFGEDSDLRTRAGKLDEGLEIVAGLWSGEPFGFEGRHYTVREIRFDVVPVQRPRIPVWVAATWPHDAPVRRAARWDGIAPMQVDGNGMPVPFRPEQIRTLRDRIAELRGAADGFDIQVGGETPGEDVARAAEIVQPLAEAGATWWSETISEFRGSLEVVRERILQGPPRT